MESKVINHFYHEHPLILKENANAEVKEGTNCYACGTPVANLEMAYVCMNSFCILLGIINRGIILHKKCGELPLQISHPKHREHPLNLFDFHKIKVSWCVLCGRDLVGLLGYICSRCPFRVHTTCVDSLLEGRQELKHPSHPDHPLTLMRKPAFAFRCDGCGAQDVDMAYICTTCEFWVHKSCALLPTILPTNHQYHHHHHPLFLIFSSPEEHLFYKYRCDVCDKFFDRTCWVYFCDVCRYFVHLKCVGSTSYLIEDDEDDGGGSSDVIHFPLDANDVSNKLITPFVMREKGLDNIPNTTSNLFLSNYHDHPLSLVSEETNNDEEESIKICDVCVTPISSSSPYYHCPSSSCSYFIHSICSLLPNTLHSSSPDLILKLYGTCQKKHDKKHNFTLYKSKGRETISHWLCNLCNLHTNGMGYACEEGNTKIDVKCAALPTTSSIQYSSHPRHHKPQILTRIPPQEKFGTKKEKRCHLCQITFNNSSRTVYCCNNDDCDFALHPKCALLPRSITEHEVDNKHPLLLMSDASLDHPSDFYCEFCEGKMSPKNYMYHCRQCDISFHRVCSKTKSGVYRNIKLGRQFELRDIHPNHPLTYTYVTLKRRCDLCHKKKKVYTFLGFECASCYYVVCEDCGCRELAKII